MKNSIADIQLALNRFIQDDYQMGVDCLSIKFEYESYSWDLPYFQSVKDLVYFYRYVDYLREHLKELEGVETAPIRKSESATKRTLEVRLNEAQLSLLLDCVNELHLFATPITTDDLLGFFNPTFPL
jgi:hypothetical protein